MVKKSQSSGNGGDMMQAVMALLAAKGNSKGGTKKEWKNEKSGGWKKESDPAGSGRVFIRGFDFNTTDEQFESHIGTAGKIHKIRWVTKGSAEVVFVKKAAAQKAANTLDKSQIPGNSRFIDVLLKESE